MTKATFRLNEVHLRKVEKPQDEEQKKFYYGDEHRRDIADILVGLFGTPDEPNFPAIAGETEPVVEISRLRIAAGPVGSDQQGNPHGLYREHCSHCHGVTGDGIGPTAVFLNPYPRDYRLGSFKFKATPKGAKPTRDDLKRILQDGIPGTAMPSFVLLAAPDLDRLIDYVIYLSIRGEVERKLIEELAELEEGQRLIDVGNRNSPRYAEQIGRINEIVADVVDKWRGAGESIEDVPARPAAWNPDSPDFDPAAKRQAIVHGRELFLGTLDCKKCHGVTGLGDGTTNDWDDWTLDWSKEFNIDPSNAVQTSEFVAAGALPPRNIRPRNLRLGVYRGGRRPIDLYWRIKNGIEGAPMPAAPASTPPDDIWAVVEYVMSLPYESISETGLRKRVNEKETR